MARKSKKVVEETTVEPVAVVDKVETTKEVTSAPELNSVVVEKKEKKERKQNKLVPKYLIGSIVYVRKDADADLNGFKLFPQYKKYTYTVEAYDDDTGVYTLRKLNLTLNVKESSIVAPDERAHDTINRLQF